MSSVLHPVGPEPPQTYWLRRALVLTAAILVLAVVVVLIVSQTNNSSAISASPAPTAPTASAASAAPTPASTASPRPAGAPSASTTTTTKPKASGTASAKPAKPTKVPILACPADQLRATLTGKTRLKPKKSNTFVISLINGSGQTCRLAVNGANFELKIYSGTDRIWSSDDCSKAVKKINKTVRAERAVAWRMTWDGRRSRDDCKRRPEIPKAGTYFATAQYDGAKPVQLRMILR